MSCVLSCILNSIQSVRDALIDLSSLRGDGCVSPGYFFHFIFSHYKNNT